MAPLRILLVLLLALASSTQPCRAQLLGPCGPAEANYVYLTCKAHLTMPAVTQPGYYCCVSLDSRIRYYSASCYCDIYNQWQAAPRTLGIDMERAYALPKACILADVDMTTCAPPNAVAPPSPPRLSPPPPPGFSFPYPPDAVAPPGSTSAPGGLAPAPTVSTSESSGKSSSTPLALPLGISGGVFVLIVALLSFVKIHLKWDLNAPCSCCNRRKPQPQADDVHGDKVPAKYGI